MRQNRLILISLLVGIAAVILATFWLRSQRESVQVVVVTSAVKAGARLTEDNLGYLGVSKEEITADAVLNRDPLIGRFAKFDIPTGEVVKERLLLPAGATRGLAAGITPGKRAFAIRVNEVAGVAGFALPGNFVDVFLGTKDASGQPSSKLILEHVLVLAVAQEQSVSGEAKPKVVDVVTLEVTPQQAEKLDMARMVGGLSLALRNQNDDVIDKGNTIRGEDLRSQTGVEIIRGTDRVVGASVNN